MYRLQQRSSEDHDSDHHYTVQPITTINSLITDQHAVSSVIDSVSVSNFLEGLTIRLPIICTLPERLGYYSCRVHPDGETDSYQPNKMSLPYLRPDYQSLKNVDLASGFSYKPKFYRVLPESDHILQWIHESPDNEISSNVNFICTSSRILRSILNVPYNGAVSWVALAIKIGRTIYLTLRDPNTYIKRGGTFSHSQLLNAHVGFKFSELVTLQPNGTKPRTFKSKNRDSFYTVNKLEVGQYKLIYPNRVDCILDSSQYSKSLGEMRFAQLRNRPCEWNSEQKPDLNVVRAIAWWMGSFLGGADTIIIGEKSHPFKIRDITTIKSDDLLQVQSRNGVRWTPKKCVDNLKKTLSYIESNVQQERAVYRIRWNHHRQNIECRKLRESIYNYLPHWYIHGQSTN